MTLQDRIRAGGAILLLIYLAGFTIADVYFVIMARVVCVRNNGWIGFFWCPDSLIATILAASVKALVWPILLFYWLAI